MMIRHSFCMIALFSALCAGCSDGSDERAKSLRMIGLGMELFRDRNLEQYPRNIVDADGKPLWSWRVQLLPVMELDFYYRQLRLDEPWDSTHNSRILAQMPPRVFAINPQTPDGHADVQAVIGPGFGFSPDGDEPITKAGKDTLMLVEVAPERAVFWAKPNDYVWNPEKPTDGLGAPGASFFLASHGSYGSVRISKQESADVLKKAFSRDDEPYTLMEVEGP